jgi:hypothetical protein
MFASPKLYPPALLPQTLLHPCPTCRSAPPACAAPNPPRRVLVPMTPAKPSVTKGKFTLLSYNLLADLYATVSGCRAGGRLRGGADVEKWWFSFLCGGGGVATAAALGSAHLAPAAAAHPLPSCLAHLSPTNWLHHLAAGRPVWVLPPLGAGLALPQAQPAEGAAGLRRRHLVPAGGAVKPLPGAVLVCVVWLFGGRAVRQHVARTGVKESMHGLQPAVGSTGSTPTNNTQ